MALSANLALQAAVIDFNSPDDLLLFNQQPNKAFWSYSATAGREGGGGLTGSNAGTAGWGVLSQGFAADTASVSAGIYFKLIPQEQEGSGYSLSFGVTSDPTYASSMSSGNEQHNHYAATLHYSSSPANRQHRLFAHSMNKGVLSSESTAQTPLVKDAWYYLALDSTFNSETSTYSMTATLYTTVNGSPATSVMSVTMSDFSNATLSDASVHYFFFGLDGRSLTRGIGAVDGFTYDVQLIPEPGAQALLGGVALLVASIGCLRRERGTNPSSTSNDGRGK